MHIVRTSHLQFRDQLIAPLLTYHIHSFSTDKAAMKRFMDYTNIVLSADQPEGSSRLNVIWFGSCSPQIAEKNFCRPFECRG